MVARLEQLCDLHCLFLEVDPAEGRIWRIAGAVDDHEGVVLREGQLAAPGRRSVPHAAVDEDDSRARSEGLDVHPGERTSFATFGQAMRLFGVTRSVMLGADG